VEEKQIPNQKVSQVFESQVDPMCQSMESITLWPYCRRSTVRLSHLHVRWLQSYLWVKI